MILFKQETKYIRTKNDVCTFEKYCLDNATRKTFHILITNEEAEDIEIINQADTIDELCDKFIFHDMETGTFTVFDSLLPLQKHSKINVDYEQFGSILVIDENGIPTLKPVAKMNDKGEMELI